MECKAVNTNDELYEIFACDYPCQKASESQAPRAHAARSAKGLSDPLFSVTPMGRERSALPYSPYKHPIWNRGNYLRLWESIPHQGYHACHTCHADMLAILAILAMLAMLAMLTMLVMLAILTT